MGGGRVSPPGRAEPRGEDSGGSPTGPRSIPRTVPECAHRRRTRPFPGARGPVGSSAGYPSADRRERERPRARRRSTRPPSRRRTPTPELRIPLGDPVRGRGKHVAAVRTAGTPPRSSYIYPPYDALKGLL